MSLPCSKVQPGSVEAFILAGGQSSRMGGQDKALFHFNGKPLIETAIETLHSCGLNPRIAGARSDLSSFAAIIPDDAAHPGLGPLSGICAGLGAAKSRYAVFLPVDLPLMPASLIAYLLHHAEVTGSAITLASLSGFLETFPVVIDCAAVSSLSISLRSQDRKCLTAFRAAAGALQRPFTVVTLELLLQAGQVSHPHSLPAQAWFLSINSPQDLLRASSFLADHVQLS